jgi:CRP-like cAMP-binding protein
VAANLVDQLKQVPLFSSLNQRQLKRLARRFKERDFRSGSAIVRQGEFSGVSFFVIAEGEASVAVDGTEVARLGPNDHFGELGLIGERVRSATVTADGRLRCLVMSSWYFRSFVNDNPDVAWKLLQHLVDLVAEEQGRRPAQAG